MTAALRVAGTPAGTNGAASLNVTVPSSGVVAGDVALLLVETMQSGTTVSVTTGWTKIGSATGPAQANLTSDMWVKVLTQGEGGSTVVVSPSVTNIRVAAVVDVYSGVDTTTPIDAWAASLFYISTGTTTVTGNAVTATGAGLLVENVGERGNPVGTGWTPPAGVTERNDYRVGFVGTDVSLAVGDAAVSGAGSAGGHTWTSTASVNHHAAWTVVLKQGAAPPAGPTVYTNEGYEGGSVGTTISTSNTTAALIDTNGGTGQFNANSIVGNQSMQVVTTTAARFNTRFDFTSITDLYARWYQRIDATTATGDVVAALLATGTTSAQVQVRGVDGRTVRLFNGATSVATSTAVLPLAGWARFEWHVNLTATTQELRVFYGAQLASDTPSFTLSGAANTTANVNRFHVGLVTAAASFTGYYDAVKVQNTTWVGAEPGTGTPAGVGVSGVWRPAASYVGVSGVWRPVLQRYFGNNGQWLLQPAGGPPPATQTYPWMGLSAIDQSDGSGFAAAVTRSLNDLQFKSSFVYFSPSTVPLWSDRCDDYPADHDLVVSTKHFTSDSAWVTEHSNFVSGIPIARSGRVYVVMNEEPETDLTGTEFIRRANLIRSVYSGHPVASLSVCLMEWTLNTGSGRGDWHQWVPDWVERVGWSVYAYDSQIKSGAGIITPVGDVVGRVVSAMSSDGRAWSAFAGGCGVVTSRDPVGGTFRASRAQWLYDWVRLIQQNRGGHANWFDYDWTSAGGTDFRLRTDPALQAKFSQARADFSRQVNG
jgi:hypothetical protein